MLVPLRRTQWYPVWPVMDRSTNLSVILIYKKKKKKLSTIILISTRGATTSLISNR